MSGARHLTAKFRIKVASMFYFEDELRCKVRLIILCHASCFCRRPVVPGQVNFFPWRFTVGHPPFFRGHKPLKAFFRLEDSTLLSIVIFSGQHTKPHSAFRDNNGMVVQLLGSCTEGVLLCKDCKVSSSSSSSIKGRFFGANLYAHRLVFLH